jgi:hypothetical protein
MEVVHESDRRAKGGGFVSGVAFYLFLAEMTLRFWKVLGSGLELELRPALASFALSLRVEGDRDGQ